MVGTTAIGMSASTAARCSTPTATGADGLVERPDRRRMGQNSDGEVEVQLLEDVGREGKRALKRRADELTKWAAGVRVSPRFPSPLSRARRTIDGDRAADPRGRSGRRGSPWPHFLRLV